MGAKQLARQLGAHSGYMVTQSLVAHLVWCDCISVFNNGRLSGDELSEVRHIRFCLDNYSYLQWRRSMLGQRSKAAYLSNRLLHPCKLGCAQHEQNSTAFFSDRLCPFWDIV